MFDPINHCARMFGEAPREFSFMDRLSYLRVGRPLWLWLNPSDQLNVLFRNMRTLFREGTVVWGHIIQANQLMFQDGDMNCPGEVVYSLADSKAAEPEYLQDLAHALYSLKGTAPSDPELAPIADYLTDEMIRVFGLAVPSTLSPSIRCQISTTFFVRKHLPNRRLCSPLLPLVVNPWEPNVAMPLPAKYWPEPFVDWWRQ